MPDFGFSNWKKIRFSLKNSNFGGQKRFSDHAQNWHICGSDNINLFEFGKFWTPIFSIGKKSDLVRKIRILAVKKGSPILLKIGSAKVQSILIYFILEHSDFDFLSEENPT